MASSNPTTGLASTKLFTPLKIGNITLKHRVMMAPLTRVRSPEHIPDDNVVEYYSQRASDGGLLISEAVHISVMGGNYYGIPGIFTPEHQRAWKKVTDAVHAKGGFIFCQLWHIGRAAHPLNIGGRAPFGPSANRIEEGMVYFTPQGPLPHVEAQAMTLTDIATTISDYVHAAKLAIASGFDGVEIHSANGYLLDQFLCDNINTRTDAYGGSIQNRARLALEVTDAVSSAIGRDRVGIRFSPFGFFQGTQTSDIISTYGHAISECEKRGLAYIHLIEPRSDLFSGESVKLQRLQALAKAQGRSENALLSLAPFRELVKQTPLITNGGFNAQNSAVAIESDVADAIAYGRYFISNPDLPERLARGYPLGNYDRGTFYTPDAKGYTDYPAYSGAKL